MMKDELWSEKMPIKMEGREEKNKSMCVHRYVDVYIFGSFAVPGKNKMKCRLASLL